MKRASWIVTLLAALVAAGVISKGWFCRQYPDQPMCVEPTPEPTPSPTVEPTPTPSPSPTPTVEPTPPPTPTPTPPASACPKKPGPGSKVYVVNKNYGQGFDRTTRVWGDPEFCRLIHGVALNDCHLEGWPRRAACELELEGGCDEWQFSLDVNGFNAIPCHDDQDALASCDHFGDVNDRDDPKTPTTGDTLETLKGFEGRPLECGLQRDTFGPRAGLFTVAHGHGYVRACPPGTPLTAPSAKGPGQPTGPCGQWKPFDH